MPRCAAGGPSRNHPPCATPWQEGPRTHLAETSAAEPLARRCSLEQRPAQGLSAAATATTAAAVHSTLPLCSHRCVAGRCSSGGRLATCGVAVLLLRPSPCRSRSPIEGQRPHAAVQRAGAAPGCGHVAGGGQAAGLGVRQQQLPLLLCRCTGPGWCGEHAARVCGKGGASTRVGGTLRPFLRAGLARSSRAKSQQPCWRHT